MKPSVLSVFHYLIFFWAVLLLTPPKILWQSERSNEYNKECQLKIKNANSVSVAKENTIELLHSELLFRY